MKKSLILSVLLASALAMADSRYRELDSTSVVEDSMCIPALDGEGFLHVDEDVAGLSITVIDDLGALVALYDAAAEIEDIAALTVYAAPSANNVRVSPQAVGAADCTQMMFVDGVYEDHKWLTITVSDGQTTIMDYTRWVYLNGGTTVDAGMVVGGDALITDVISQTEFELDEGHTNTDAYLHHEFCVNTPVQWGCSTITGYDPSPTPVVTIEAGRLNFTVDIGDEFRIYRPLRGQLATATALAAVAVDVGITTDDLDIITGVGGALLDENSITSSTIATSAIGASEVAPDAIGASELGTGAIDADAIDASAIGASEIATGAIDADAIAADAITATAIADDAIGSSEIAADALAVATGTCDSGSTTTCVDAALTQADNDYWAGMAIVFTSGTADGQVRCVYDFDAAADRLTFRPATTQAITVNTYALVQHATCGGVIAP